MAQTSRFWDGTTVGDATVAPYDAVTEFSRVMQSISGAGGIATNQSAVFRGELNELAVTGVATPVSVASGRAITAGTWYENDAATTVAIPTPAVSTRIDRIVLRKDWSALVQTVRVTRIAGVEGGGAPALVQIYGTTWDEPLAQASITTGGVITVTDQRQFVGEGFFSGIQSFAVGDLLYANTTTTLARLADAAAGSVLVSGGVGVAPAWSANPTVTSLTTTGTASVGSTLAVTSTINGQTISATASFTGTVAVATGVAIGANASATGALRLAYLGGINSRNSGNSADGIVLATIGAAEIQIGGATFTNVNLPNAGQFRVGTSTNNTFMTNGITVQQGAAANEIVSFKSTSVAHGMTTATETDTFGNFTKHQSSGGFRLQGLSGGVIGFSLYGAETTEDTTKAVSSTGSIALIGATKSGTNYGAKGATSNIAIIANFSSTRFIFQSDGTSYEDVGTAWTNYDDHDDIALLTDLSLAVSRDDDPIHREIASFLRYNRQKLQDLDLVHFNDDGHHFANRSKIQMLLIGASRQLGKRVESLEQENRELRALVGAT